MNVATLLLTLTLLWCPYSENQKIYEWRGNGRSGIYSESGLLKVWPADGPREIWSVENIGNGFGSPVITEQNIYVTGEIDSMAILFCLNLSGKKEWQTTIGKEWTKSNPGSRSTPTIVDKLIYVGSGMGNLFCLDRSNGKIIWSKDLALDFKGVLPLHGHSESPLIDGDKVFWTPGGKEYNVVALNRFTGKLIWYNRGFGERSGYNPPQIIRLSNRSIIATFSAYHLMGFDSETGKLLWSHEQNNFPLDKRTLGNGDTHANTVLYENGSIYYAEGDGNGGVKLTLSKDGESITEVWHNPGFDSYMGGVVKIGNYLYCGGTVKPSLLSINATSGILTDSLRIGSGAIISSDNMLYYYSQKGDLMLISYNEGKMEKVSSFKIKKGTLQHFSQPVINKGILYQRHGSTLIAFDIRKKTQ